MHRTVGNYTLGSLIGRGATSEVYAAEHRFLGDAVAIKLMRSELASDDAATETFVAEAAKTRAIAHPNIVRVIDFGRDDDSRCCYLVLERVHGESLAARLRRVNRLDEAEVRRVGAAIADGMHAAHAAGIVHRDLKPGNVMLAGDDPKVVDFGIAKSLGTESAMTTGRRIGTLAYMAPEQLTGGLIAPCVDVWALGVIMFEAVTGRLPFDGFADGRCPQLFEIAPRARTLAAISPELDDLLTRCLEREPGRRPTSMAEVARELRSAGNGERITADVGAVLAAPQVLAAPRLTARRWWPLAIGGAGVAAAAIVAIVMLGSAPSDGSSRAPVPPPTTTRVTVPIADATVEPTVTAPIPDAGVEPEVTMPQPDRVVKRTAIEVRSTPAGADIYLNGVRLGVTPAKISIAAPASLELRRDGYKTKRVRVNGTRSVDVVLKRKEGLN